MICLVYPTHAHSSNLLINTEFYAECLLQLQLLLCIMLNAEMGIFFNNRTESQVTNCVSTRVEVVSKKMQT